MLEFNPYNLEHVAMMEEWLADKKRGINKPCPFLTREQMEAMQTRKKKKKVAINAGLLKR
jgi:hypothetical protein